MFYPNLYKTNAVPSFKL